MEFLGICGFRTWILIRSASYKFNWYEESRLWFHFPISISYVVKNIHSNLVQFWKQFSISWILKLKKTIYSLIIEDKMLVFLQFSGTSSCRQQRHFKQFRNISSWYVLFPSRLWCNYCYASNKTCKTESFKRIRALCITNSIGIAKIVNLSKDLKTNVPKMHQGL